MRGKIGKIASKLLKLLTATESTKPCYNSLQLGELIYAIVSARSEFGLKWFTEGNLSRTSYFTGVYFYFRSLLNYADSLAAMGSRNFSNLEAYKSKIPENVYVNVTLSS